MAPLIANGTGTSDMIRIKTAVGAALVSLASIFAASFGGLAAAQETSAVSPGWVIGNFSRKFEFRGSIGDDDIYYDGVMLYTGDATKAGVILTCSERFGTGTALTYAPRDFSTLLYEPTAVRRIRFVPLRIIVDGDRGELRNYLHRRAVKLVEAMDDSDDLRLINAIARNKPVRLEISGLANIDLDLPPADDNFRAFIAACPALSYKS